jgi:hypothetical protein
MAYTGSITAGNEDNQNGLGGGDSNKLSKGSRVLGARRLFMLKNPGSPGKLGKSSTKAESLAKLRGKGALA